MNSIHHLTFSLIGGWTLLILSALAGTATVVVGTFEGLPGVIRFVFGSFSKQ
jgi:hypothetical protein